MNSMSIADMIAKLAQKPVVTTPNGNEPIRVYAGGMYHYGFSDSPRPIFVDSVLGIYVTFYHYPYEDRNRTRQRWDLFQACAADGTSIQRRRLAWFVKRFGKGHEHIDKLAAHYDAVLAGRPGDTWKRDDIRMVVVEFNHIGTGDGWSEFENYYPHSVSSSHESDGLTVYESYDFNRQQAEAVRQRMCPGGDMPSFRWLGMREER